MYFRASPTIPSLLLKLLLLTSSVSIQTVSSTPLASVSKSRSVPISGSVGAKSIFPEVAGVRAARVTVGSADGSVVGKREAKVHWKEGLRKLGGDDGDEYGDDDEDEDDEDDDEGYVDLEALDENLEDDDDDEDDIDDQENDDNEDDDDEPRELNDKDDEDDDEDEEYGDEEDDLDDIVNIHDDDDDNDDHDDDDDDDDDGNYNDDDDHDDVLRRRSPSPPPRSLSSPPVKNLTTRITWAVLVRLYPRTNFKGKAIIDRVYHSSICEDLGSHAYTASSYEIRQGCCNFYGKKDCKGEKLFRACTGKKAALGGNNDKIASFKCFEK